MFFREIYCAGSMAFGVYVDNVLANPRPSFCFLTAAAEIAAQQAAAAATFAAASEYGTLVLSHRTHQGGPAEYFTKDEACACVWNSLADAAHKFSRLSDLEQYRASDGAFYLTLVYPNASTPGKTLFRWKQTRYASRLEQ